MDGVSRMQNRCETAAWPLFLLQDYIDGRAEIHPQHPHLNPPPEGEEVIELQWVRSKPDSELGLPASFLGHFGVRHLGAALEWSFPVLLRREHRPL